MKNSIKNKKGGSAILVVVIVGAAALLMALGAARLGLGEMEMSYMSQKGSEALYLADACAETSLERLRKNPNYSGGNLNLGSGSCIINISSPTSDQRLIIINSSVKNFNKKLKINAKLNQGAVSIDSWSETKL